MKKLLYVLIIISLLFNLYGCSSLDPIIASIPNYTDKVSYTSGDFQDYTDYAKYYYESVDSQDLNQSKYFKEVTSEDVEEILSYIRNFEGWVDTEDGELRENYDFDKSYVSVGDYFYIETKYGQPIGTGTYEKFDNYDIYYFDIDNQILYYFHNNI